MRPVYEFRPLPDYFRGEFRRYSDGKWIPDDGEYDLAFHGTSRDGYPVCLYFTPTYYQNIACSWLTTHWSEKVAKHPDGNAWHYAGANGKRSWGKPDIDHGNHPNMRAGSSGMSRGGCCNGRHVEFHADDKHIAAGLLRDRETKEVFTWPEGLKCMYCGAIPPVYESGERR